MCLREAGKFQYSGFFKLDAMYILDQTVLCCKGCPVLIGCLVASLFISKYHHYPHKLLHVHGAWGAKFPIENHLLQAPPHEACQAWASASTEQMRKNLRLRAGRNPSRLTKEPKNQEAPHHFPENLMCRPMLPSTKEMQAGSQSQGPKTESRLSQVCLDLPHPFPTPEHGLQECLLLSLPRPCPGLAPSSCIVGGGGLLPGYPDRHGPPLQEG